jgi:hypothetical protein
MNRKNALDALRRAAETLNDLGVSWWLDCGVLLGAIREGDFLAHDQDIDLGVWGTDAYLETCGGFVEAGFDPAGVHGTPDHGYGQSFRRKNVKVDLLYFYPHPRGAWQGCWAGDHLLVSVFEQDILPIEPFCFQGIDCRVPADPIGMLEARYDDWQTVVTEWDWRTDPKCITPETRIQEV